MKHSKPNEETLKAIRDLDKSCRGKRFYRTKNLAEYAAVCANCLASHETIRSYKCRYCNGWHIGHGDSSEKSSYCANA